MNLSDDDLAPMDRLAALPLEVRREVLNTLPEEVVAQLRYIWELWARPEQLEPPGDWRYWLMRSGRGAGKTRAGAEWVRGKVESGIYSQLHLVARTEADWRDTMVEGESGILAVSRPDFRPQFRPRRRDLTWPNGAVAHLFSAEEPDRLRGPQCEAAWCDEIASWRYPAAFDNLLLGLRSGSDPRCVITSTPRPTALLRSLIANPATVVTVSSTYANRLNLAQPFLDSILERYEGTRLGRQEIYGELLEDVPGALWHHERLDELRVKKAPDDLKQIVVAVDPAVSCSEDSDETGIVVIGLDEHQQAFVLADLSGRYPPNDWAHKVVDAFHRHQANWVVAETNQGGDLVRDMLRQIDPTLPIKMVHAKRGKYQRAEPAATLYEQNRVHHVGCYAALEDQMCIFTSDIDRRQGSPDRVDALVWGLTHLLLKRHEPKVARGYDLGGGGRTESLGGGWTWTH
jgi:phage terminase large subunit-like protein